MADSKVTDLTELNAADDADLIMIVDLDAGPATSKKISTQNLIKNNLNVATNTTHRGLVNNPHTVTKAQVGLGSADDTSDINKPVSTAQQAALDTKYDNTNPNNYETPLELNNRDTANRARGNHTGTQLADTISNFVSTVLASILTGISFVVATPVLATDSILQAIGKLQAQFNNRPLAWLQYSTNVTQNAILAETVINLATDQNSFLNGLFDKPTNANFRALVDMEAEVSFSFDMDGNANNSGMEVWVAINGVQQPIGSVRAFLRNSNLETLQSVLPPVILNLAANDIVTFRFISTEGNTITIEQNNNGFSWAKVKVLRLL